MSRSMHPATADPTSTGTVRPVTAALILGTVLAVVGFWPSMAALAELWSNPARTTYQHGYLIAAIALWLVFRERHRVESVYGTASLSFMTATAIASIAWAVAVRAGLQTVHMLLWPVVLWLALAGLFGWRAGRALVIPVGYLYFAMPVWDALTPVLQWATVTANHLLTQVTGIPALIDGDLVYIPSGTFEIEGRCSGLNYFVVSLAIGVLYGEVYREPWRRRLLLAILIATLAMVSNWIRVFAVIVAGHLTDMQHYLVRVDHQNFGWVLFAVVLVVFFLIVGRLPATTRAQEADGQRSVPVPGRFSAAAALLALAAMEVGPVLEWVAQLRPSAQMVWIEAPESVTSAGPDGIGDIWQPVFPGADAEFREDYIRDDGRVGVYVAAFLRQSQGRELVGHGTNLLGGGPWAWAGRESLRRPRGNAESIPWTEREARMGDRHALLWWTYQVGPRQVATGAAEQFWYGIVSLWSEPVSSIVALHAECVPDCDAARQRLQQVVSAGLPRVSSSASGEREP